MSPREPSTPTGIPITQCTMCGRTHPITRGHCARCTSPSMFLDPESGLCRRCRDDRDGGAA